MTRIQILSWSMRLAVAHGQKNSKRARAYWRRAIRKQLMYDSERGTIADIKEVLDSCHAPPEMMADLKDL